MPTPCAVGTSAVTVREPGLDLAHGHASALDRVAHPLLGALGIEP